MRVICLQSNVCAILLESHANGNAGQKLVAVHTAVVINNMCQSECKDWWETKLNAIGPRDPFKVYGVLMEKGVSDWKRDCRVKGQGLGKDQMLVVQQDSSEVVDWPNGAE